MKRDLCLAAFLIHCLAVAACSVGGNDPNPVVTDADADGIPDSVELTFGLDPANPADAALDPDADGLTNLAELTVHMTSHTDADSDDDGLNDGDEIKVHMTGPKVADTDGDGLADGAEVFSFGTNPKLTDTDGDSIADGDEVNGFKLYDKTTVVISNPLATDSDSDGIHDGIEKAVQDTFAGYASGQNATAFLTGALHPVNTAVKPSLGGLSFTATTLTAAALELDPDGDGKPTLEELFHGTDPNDDADEFLYVYEDNVAGARKPLFLAMDAANFVYVPGGWDVDGDGTVDDGFLIAKFEAKSAGTANTNISDLPQLLAGDIVYNRPSQRFIDRLCDNTNGGTGTDAGTSDTDGQCRGNKYALAGTTLATSGAVMQVEFVAAGVPYTGLGWAEARQALRASPVDAQAAQGGPYVVDLPTERQALQIVRLAINHPENWTGGALGTGSVVQGHTDNVPPNALSVANAGSPFDQTGNSGSAGPAQRRTMVLANGIMARDFNVPLTYRTEVWDLSGNVAEWSLGLFAATDATSRPTGRAGGDRFADGLSELESYAGTNISGPAGDTASMPAWWKPLLKTAVLATGTGVYNDGFSGSDVNGDSKSDGAFTNSNLGYGSETYADGYAATARGSSYASGSNGGIATADVQNGLGRQQPQIGFRAASTLP